jgi:hypothetical protein
MNASAHRGSGPPPLHTAVLSHIAADWPEFAAIRGAAGTHSHRQRLQQTVSIAITAAAEAKVQSSKSTPSRCTTTDAGGYVTAHIRSSRILRILNRSFP